jgi:pyrimidine deaminase RibD-like protein
VTDAVADRRFLRQAIELSRRCPPSRAAFSVGALLVDAGGAVLATGFSRECGPHDHAEEAALAKMAGRPRSGAIIYSSLEPCLRRLSRSRSCCDLIVAAGITRVVLAWREPPVFVPGGGAAWLAERGVLVTEVPELTAEALAVNAHLLPG